VWNACAKARRLENAFQMRGIDPDNFSIKQLDKVLMKRGITDSQLNPIVGTLISVLEPPGCEMTHCKLYGNSTSPMNCADGRTPGRCKILKEYRERKNARIAKDWRNVLNDHSKSIKYDDMQPDESLEKATLAAQTLKLRAYSAAYGKRYDIALEGAQAELSEISNQKGNDDAVKR